MEPTVYRTVFHQDYKNKKKNVMYTYLIIPQSMLTFGFRSTTTPMYNIYILYDGFVTLYSFTKTILITTL